MSSSRPLPVIDNGEFERHHLDVPHPNAQFISNPERDDSHRSPVAGRFARTAQLVWKLVTLPRSIQSARAGAVQSPRVLTHTLTFGCNAKCVMCDSWKLPTKGDLALAEIAMIYQDLPPMDVVRLTGGEPFVRKDFSEIYGLALSKLRPLFMHVSSNGFLTDRIVDFCCQRDRRVPLELAISIDGIAEYHNEIRGNSRAFDLAWSTLNALNDRRKELNLSLVVNQTIVNNAGLDQYELMHDRLEQLGIEHHVVIAYKESATYSLERERRLDIQTEYNSVDDLDEEKLFDLLRKAEARAHGLPFHRRWMRIYYLRGARERLRGNKKTNNPPCQALHTHLRLFPNGDVPVCQFNSQSVGNLNRQSFDEVWKSVAAAEQRKWVRRCDGCWAECEVAPTAVYTLDLLSARS